MTDKSWYIYQNAQIKGPLTSEDVIVMLDEHTVRFVDFIWADHLSKWQRIGALGDFSPLLPAYPRLPPPGLKKPENAPPPRKYLRVQASGEKAHIGGYGTYELLDLSVGGIFCKADAPPPLGSEIQFELDLKSIAQRLKVSGNIVRHGTAQGHKGFGIEFSYLNNEAKVTIENYVDEHGAIY